MKSKTRTKAIAILLSLVCFIGAYSPSMVFAEDIIIGEIVTIESLPDTTQIQNLLVGDSVDKVNLPTSLVGYLENGESVSIDQVIWESDLPFESNIVSSYVYKPLLPDGYQYSVDLIVPSITVHVKKIVTTISGIAYTRNQIAGKSLGDTIWITPANGRTLKIQKYNTTSQMWETKKTYVLSNLETQKIVIYFPSEWYSLNQVNTVWRYYIASNDTSSSFISNKIAVSATRAYQNPSPYFQIQPKVTLNSDAGYDLVYGSMGLKVAMVQRKLGMGYQWEIIGQATSDKIKAFQKQKGLKQTGTVNYNLWKLMGFSDYDWYKKAAYVSPMKTNLASTRTQHVESFISNASRYQGTEYIVGAAGAPKTGIDCSGLIMQSMYATGVDPAPISVIRHSQPGYEYESRNLWASTKLKTVAYKDKVRGDLIFYMNYAGVVIHVAIYLGDGRVIEATPGVVKISSVINTSYPRVKGVKRVFN